MGRKEELTALLDQFQGEVFRKVPDCDCGNSRPMLYRGFVVCEGCWGLTSFPPDPPAPPPCPKC